MPGVMSDMWLIRLGDPGSPGTKHKFPYKDKIGHYSHLDHNDTKRREQWYARHGRSTDKNTARYWAAKVLW